MLKGVLHESVAFPGHYHVPKMDTVVISKCGVVIDLESMHCPLLKYNPESNDSYPHVNLAGSQTYHIHRLLALTFLVCDGNPAEMHVNHIDGVKSNNDLSNLEWVTPSSNSIHAYMTGLRSDNRPVLVKDLQTGSIERFYSLNETARRFSCNPSMIYKYLNSDDLAPFRNQYTLTYEGSDWKPLTKADIGKSRAGQARSVVVVWGSGKIHIYESTSHAAEDLGMKQQSVAYHAIDGKEVQGKDFSIFYETHFGGDLAEAVRFVKDRKERVGMPKRKPTPVIVEDTALGTTEWWESIEAFAKSVGQSKNTVQKSVGKKGSWKHFNISYHVKEQCPSG